MPSITPFQTNAFNTTLDHHIQLMPSIRQRRNSDLCLSLTSIEDSIEGPSQHLSSPWNQPKFLLELHSNKEFKLLLLCNVTWPTPLLVCPWECLLIYFLPTNLCLHIFPRDQIKDRTSVVHIYKMREQTGCFAISTLYLLYHFVDFGILLQFLQLFENSRRLI